MLCASPSLSWSQLKPAGVLAQVSSSLQAAVFCVKGSTFHGEGSKWLGSYHGVGRNLIRVRWELWVWMPWGGGQEESGALSIPGWFQLPYCCITEQRRPFLSPLLGERFGFQMSVEDTQPGFFEKGKLSAWSWGRPLNLFKIQTFTCLSL